MNKKHAYVLKGITEEQVTLWGENLRDDLTMIKQNCLLIPVIELTRLEAVRMKIQMMLSNIGCHYGFKLVRI